MKKLLNPMASGSTLKGNKGKSVIKGTALVGALLLLASATFGASVPTAKRSVGSAAPSAPAREVSSATPAGTNNAVNQIQVDLRDVIARVEAATMAMSNANASTPGQYSAIVSNTAVQIRDLAVQTLGDKSQILKEADGLIEKTRGQISHVRGLATDPKVPVRQKYEQLLPNLERNLAQVMDAKTSVGSIRAELLKQADALAANAAFIGFSADVEQTEFAIEAFRDCLSQVSAFVSRLSKTIDDVGGPRLTRID